LSVILRPGLSSGFGLTISPVPCPAAPHASGPMSSTGHADTGPRAAPVVAPSSRTAARPLGEAVARQVDLTGGVCDVLGPFAGQKSAKAWRTSEGRLAVAPHESGHRGLPRDRCARARTPGRSRWCRTTLSLQVEVIAVEFDDVEGLQCGVGAPGSRGWPLPCVAPLRRGSPKAAQGSPRSAAESERMPTCPSLNG